MAVNRVAVIQTLKAMENMVKALQELEKEFRDGNPYRMALMMDAPIDTVEHLIRDLKHALGMEHWDNDE